MSAFAVVQVRIYSYLLEYGEILHFSAYLVECEKIQTRITLNKDTFHAVLYEALTPKNNKNMPKIHEWNCALGSPLIGI